MRVLFLDFDGVLHRAGDGTEDVGPLFVWLPMLAAVISGHPDVVVAVHSTWRYQYSVPELRELLTGLEKHLVTTVPRGPRSEAISWFLQANPQVLEHRILDDDGGAFGSSVPENLLLCDSALGLTTPGVLDALRDWLDASSGRSSSSHELPA